jgi:hypothetical protein
LADFGVIDGFFERLGTGCCVIISVMGRFKELEIASDEFSIENLVEQITHVLSVTLPLIRDVLLQ